MFRFLHAADIHLDSPLKGLERYEGAPVDAIRQATRQALAKLVDLALAERVDFVLIAGDLYDGNWRDHNTGLCFVRHMTRLRDAGIPLYLIAGNHDAESRMTRSLRLPRNPGGDEPFLSAQAAETRRLDDLGVAIHGRSFRTQAETTNLAAEYPAGDAGLYNIGLLHTSLIGDEEHDTYAPCTVADLQAKNYQYWALGHIHRRRVVCEHPLIVYPGNIQGRHIRETGAKGCYLVTVSDRAATSIEFRPLDVFRWEVVTIDCEGAPAVDDILERCRRRLLEVVQLHDLAPVGVRVILQGATPLHQELAANPRQWTADLRAAALDAASDQLWVEQLRIGTSPPRSAGNQMVADAAGAELAAYLQELLADETLLHGLAASVKALNDKLPLELTQGADGLRPADADWLRGILADVQPLLLERLAHAEEA